MLARGFGRNKPLYVAICFRQAEQIQLLRRFKASCKECGLDAPSGAGSDPGGVLYLEDLQAQERGRKAKEMAELREEVRAEMSEALDQLKSS